jgi:isoleucyl-tRNA synthetase
LARDLVRRIQTLRKDADFQLDDRIVTYYDADEELGPVFEEWAGYIQAETLSTDLVPGPMPGDVAQHGAFKLGGHPTTLGVKRV